MTFAIILPAQWKRAKFFFKTVPEAKEFNKSEDETCFIKSKEGGIFIVYKDFFIKFNTDFIDLYVSEKNENYVKIAKNNPEAKTAFVQTMKKYSIILEEGVIDDVEVFKLHFPIDSKPILQLEEIKKKNEIFIKI